MSDERIPVVIAAPPMRTGGTEQHLLYILPGLAERGFDITVVLLAGGGALEARLRQAPVNVISPEGDRGRPIRTFAHAMALRRAVQATGARVLHAFLSEPYFAAYAAHRFLGPNPPKLVHGRRSLAFYAERHRFARFLERKMHGRASMLVGNSTAVATELMTECRAPDKVAVIHNGIPLLGAIDRKERASARARFGFEADDLVLAMVANFHSYKGHVDLIEGMAIAAPELTRRWKLLLPGRDGGTLEEVKALAAARGILGNIVLPGEMQGSREVYAAADIGLLVSHTEGFSNSLIEGMSAGLPMIATAVGGNLDAIVDGETGLLTPVISPDRIAEAVLALANDSELRARMGAAAQQAAETRFSLESCINAYERLWRDLASMT